MYDFSDRADPPARPTRSFEPECWAHRAIYRTAAVLPTEHDYKFNRGERRMAALAKREGK